MDTLFSRTLGLLLLLSAAGNVSGQMPTGKDERVKFKTDTLGVPVDLKRESLCCSTRLRNCLMRINL